MKDNITELHDAIDWSKDFDQLTEEERETFAKLTAAENEEAARKAKLAASGGSSAVVQLSAGDLADMLEKAVESGVNKALEFRVPEKKPIGIGAKVAREWSAKMSAGDVHAIRD